MHRKVKILLSLVLLTIFCAISVFSQQDSANTNKLTWSFISLDDSKFSSIGYAKKQGSEKFILDKNSQKFIELLSEFSSEMGSVKIDKKKQLIITDELNRIKTIEEFIKILEDSPLTFEQLFSSKTDGTGLYTLEVQNPNLDTTIGCGTGREKVRWQKQQSKILLSVVERFISVKGTLEINGRKKSLIVSDNWNRILLIKQITELLDRKFLEDIPETKPNIIYENGVEIITDVLPRGRVSTYSVKIRSVSFCPKVNKSLYLNNFRKIVARRLSYIGKVEIDDVAQEMIVMDFSSNLKSLKKLIFFLDKEQGCRIFEENK